MAETELEMIGARIPANLDRELDEYCDELGIKKSEGVRRLLQNGLEEEQRTDGVHVTYPALAGLLGWFLITMDWIEVAPGQPVGWLGLAILVAIVLLEVVRWVRGDDR